MSNILGNWWRSYQFSRALRRGEQKQVHKLWGAIESSGARLNWLEKLFKSNREATKKHRAVQEELSSLRLQVTESSQRLGELELLRTESSQQIQELELAIAESSQQVQQSELLLKESSQQIQQLESALKAATIKFPVPRKPLVQQKSNLISPNPDFIDFISKTFKFVEHDQHFLQVTGLDHQVFDKFEASLANFIQDDFAEIIKHPNFQKEVFELDLAQAIDDLHKLKLGYDPSYNFKLSPHIYLLTYFLEGVYSSYLSWFLIYQSGLLPAKNNILDIAAGFSAVSFGLDLFLESGSDYIDTKTMHTSYCSVEQQGIFQDKGLEFGRRYLEAEKQNTYLRFDTASIFDVDLISKLPKQFFDFIVISHCFFKDEKTRKESEVVYKNIFNSCLNDLGFVLLIIQDELLSRLYGFSEITNVKQETGMVEKLLSDLGLSLVWYKYLLPTNARDKISKKDFGAFARKNLPPQNFLHPLHQRTDQKYIHHYTLDDYVILARK